MSRLGEKISRLKESEPQPTSEDQLMTSTGSTTMPSVTSSSDVTPPSTLGFNYREASPIKEAILTKFARLAPASLTSTASSTSSTSTSTPMTASAATTTTSLTESESLTSLLTTPSSDTTPVGPSWIHQVKGRIARTVDAKVSEYRQERELRRSVQNIRTGGGGIPELDERGGDVDSLSGNSAVAFVSLPHSFSESLLTLDNFDERDEAVKVEPRNSTPVITPSSTPPQNSLLSSAACSTTTTPAREEGHPQSPREQRRFRFSFRGDRSAKSSVVKNLDSESLNGAGSTNDISLSTTSTSAVDITVAPSASASGTPSKPGVSGSSLRLRMMGLMGKSPSTSSSSSQRNEPAVSVNMNELPESYLGDEPFSGIDLGMHRIHPDEGSNRSSPKDRPSRLGLRSIHDLLAAAHDAEVETAMEADEALSFDQGEGGDASHDSSDLVNETEPCDGFVSTSGIPPQLHRYLQHWWSLAIPLCFILIIQILPLPFWVTGFITGVLLTVPTAAYVTLRVVGFLDDSPPRTQFVENVKRKKAKRSAIIVQEEIQSFYTWMNLWPLKKGPYDPLTYDVRKTSTVRVTLHGPWLELRFPRVNLPLRRTHDDVEPPNIEFHDRFEVIDLSTCSIELMPQNLPSKRIWSKKYPIMIRTNMRKPKSSPETSRKMAASDTNLNNIGDSESGSEEGSAKLTSGDNNNDAFEDVMFDAKESFSDDDADDDVSRRVGDDENDASGSRKRQKVTLRRRKNASVVKNASSCDKKAASPTSDKPVMISDESGYVVIPEEESFKTFYLFTRTSREKEEWFNRFLVAAKFMEDWEHQNPKDPKRIDPNYETEKVKAQKFNIFMEDYFQARSQEDAAKKHEEMLATPALQACAREQLAFVNIFAARLWHDLHDSRVFIDYLRDKITRKLLKVKIAQYFNDVRVTTLDLGPQLPKVLSSSLPWQDELGLWVNFEIEYTGLCQATVETQGIHWPTKDEPDREAQELALSRLAATMDSDEEDSAEEDDDAPSPAGGDPGIFDDEDPGFDGLQPHAATGFRARMLDSLLKSEFLAKVAESDWVKKNITGKAITLQLQLHALRGTLTVNFPPAPSDRVWYGFRKPPELEIALRPCFGGHPLGKYEGTLSTLMKHLEKRLKVEFMKVLVHPNLDDEVLPFMDHVTYALTAATSSLKQNSLSPQ